MIFELRRKGEENEKFKVIFYFTENSTSLYYERLCLKKESGI